MGHRQFDAMGVVIGSGSHVRDDRDRALRRAARTAFAQCLGALVVVGLSLPHGGQAVRLLASPGGTAIDVDAVATDTVDFVAAVPEDELERLDGTSLMDWRHAGEALFRVELAVEPDPTGIRVHATLVDSRTREALKDFVAWRGRS